jgi:hypothetical protein
MSLRPVVCNGVSSVTAFLSPNGWPQGKGAGKESGNDFRSCFSRVSTTHG